MASSSEAQSLILTIRTLYGDIVDMPLLHQTESLSQNNDASHGLMAYSEKIKFCKKCVLHIGRSKLVFGKGPAESQVAFVGDFPSAADDSLGEPFSDESGDLLRKMVVAMKLKPEETYLTNIFKCRPPSGQVVDQDLFRSCESHIEQQFSLLKAPFIVALGEHSAKALARSESPLGVLRGQEFEWNGRRVFCTYHPRELLLFPARKKEAWEDLQAVMRAMKNA